MKLENCEEDVVSCLSPSMWELYKSELLVWNMFLLTNRAITFYEKGSFKGQFSI